MTSKLPEECVFQYSIRVDVTVCFALAACMCVCTSIHVCTLDFRVRGTSFDLPLHCAAVIGCDTVLSALSGGYSRNLTIMAPVMNMSGQLQTKARDLDKTPLYVVSTLIYEINAARVNEFSVKQFAVFTKID